MFIKRHITVTLLFLTCLLLILAATAAIANEDDAVETTLAKNGKVDTAKPTSAAEAEIAAADKLNILGLFRGVGVLEDGALNLDVSRAPTRAEAAVIAVRLSGGEAAALSGDWESPFTDIPEWAKPYIGYAYQNDLIMGVGGAVFAGSRAITASEYITLILRALGYSSGTDFMWDEAWLLSDVVGITGGRFDSETKEFSRGNAAEISFCALSAKIKGSDKTLCSYLIDEGIFTEDAARATGAGEAANLLATAQGQPQLPGNEAAPGTAPATSPKPEPDNELEPEPVPKSEPVGATEPEPVTTPIASEMEKEVFTLVNKERDKAGMKALVWNDELAAVARAHSADMAIRNYFNHISPEGLRPADRKRAAGLVFRYSAENIARGFKTPQSVVAAWMASPSHEHAILSEIAVRIGVGMYGYYWTLNLID